MPKFNFFGALVGCLVSFGSKEIVEYLRARSRFKKKYRQVYISLLSFGLVIK